MMLYYHLVPVAEWLLLEIMVEMTPTLAPTKIRQSILHTIDRYFHLYLDYSIDCELIDLGSCHDQPFLD